MKEIRDLDHNQPDSVIFNFFLRTSSSLTSTTTITSSSSTITSAITTMSSSTLTTTTTVVITSSIPTSILLKQHIAIHLLNNSMKVEENIFFLYEIK
ncbi:unnamed protein product [Rotaria sordida]|uniref:Uncharacterized protein n=1 Tax=Rotaria sordida TaxID=392033 RepID=A0A815JC03_9BILA|nr:unnamed protein product [Rotaria sordida]CAF1614614.1 unnamed protein product [Rotaria sordida]